MKTWNWKLTFSRKCLTNDPEYENNQETVKSKAIKVLYVLHLQGLPSPWLLWLNCTKPWDLTKWKATVSFAFNIILELAKSSKRKAFVYTQKWQNNLMYITKLIIFSISNRFHLGSWQFLWGFLNKFHMFYVTLTHHEWARLQLNFHLKYMTIFDAKQTASSSRAIQNTSEWLRDEIIAYFPIVAIRVNCWWSKIKLMTGRTSYSVTNN